jgi:uncharacterized protein
MDTEAQVQRCFLQLRAEGLVLGMDELLDALKIAEVASDDDLPSLLEMLWCKAQDDFVYFKSAWQRAAIELAPKADLPPTSDNVESPRNTQSPEPPSPKPQMPMEKTEKETMGALPLLAPSYAMSADYGEFKNYYPVSRRFMAYTWHYLKRDIPDGPFNQLDFERTVELVTRQGFYIMPAYRRATVNHAHLVLLLDYGGSMTPFHHYLRDLVDTACFESSLAHVEVYYFHNVPESTLYTDPHLTERFALLDAFEAMDENTSLLIVSDAGAARHRNDPFRIIITEEFLNDVKHVTQSIAWLNPMPRDRWRNTSAEEIEKLIPMFPMNEDGLTQALDILRGL